MKNRNKINAEFSMSSLTDIIFLLLIFFMLTANFVRIDNVDLPEADTQTVAALETTVTITKNGDYLLNGKKLPLSALQKELDRSIRRLENPQLAKIGIAAEKTVPWSKVMKIIDISRKLKKDAIILTKPTEQ